MAFIELKVAGKVVYSSDTDPVPGARLVEENIAPWGVDQFGTPYTSQADHDRGENLRLNDQAEVANGAQLKQGQVDITTFTGDDLVAFDIFANEIEYKVGSAANVHRFFNGYTYGTMNDFPNAPAMRAALNKKEAIMRGDRGSFMAVEWPTYTGIVRMLLAQHRGVPPEAV
jgi:hypothetical protein